MINKIKNEIEIKKGQVLKFRHNGSRNQIEEFEGIITDTYNSIFIINTLDNKIKSFTYSDILINNLEIYK